jgi:hypothetical protein
MKTEDNAAHIVETMELAPPVSLEGGDRGTWVCKEEGRQGHAQSAHCTLCSILCLPLADGESGSRMIPSWVVGRDQQPDPMVVGHFIVYKLFHKMTKGYSSLLEL